LVTNGLQGAALAFEPREGKVLRRPPRPPGEPIFDRLMIERTLIAVLVTGGVAFGAFWWMLRAGWGEPAARNALLLLLVLFLNVHIGNSRSEVRSALRLSPLRVPLLMGTALGALLLHGLAMYMPLGHDLLRTEAVGIYTWAALFALSLTVFGAIEVHKWFRAGRPSAAGPSP
jgi:magnesium-transporting ATPase (P-type)